MQYISLFLTFFKIGAFTIGGGYAMLPLIQEAVLENGWMTAKDIVNFIAVSESTPGPFAINIATYVGIQVADVFGAVCATLGVVLPSFVIILIVARCYQSFKNSKIVKSIMSGLKPAVIGLIATAVLSIGKTAILPNGFKNVVTYELACALVIFAISLFFVFKKKLHPTAVIAFSALLGITAGYIPMLVA